MQKMQEIVRKFFRVFRTLSQDEFFLYAKIRASEKIQKLSKRKPVIVWIPEDDRLITRKLMRKIYSVEFTQEELSFIACSDYSELQRAVIMYAGLGHLRLTLDLKWTVRP